MSRVVEPQFVPLGTSLRKARHSLRSQAFHGSGRMELPKIQARKQSEAEARKKCHEIFLKSSFSIVRPLQIVLISSPPYYKWAKSDESGLELFRKTV